MTQSSDNGFQEIITPKEHAVFWLDKDGYWQNEGGRFKLKKIIRRFNQSIEHDDAGYYVTQINGNRREKVYFPYEDTALFAIDIQKKEPATLRLNTGKRLPLHFDRLFRSSDNLYTINGDEWIKFSERSLLKLVPMIDTNSDPWMIYFRGQSYPILNRH